MSALDSFVVGAGSGVIFEDLLLVVLGVSVLRLVVVVVLIHSVGIAGRHAIITACVGVLVHVGLRVSRAIVSGRSCIRSV